MGTRNILHVSEIYLKENSKMSVMINGTGDSASVSGDIRAWWGLRQNWSTCPICQGAATTQANGGHTGGHTDLLSSDSQAGKVKPKL